MVTYEKKKKGFHKIFRPIDLLRVSLTRNGSGAPPLSRGPNRTSGDRENRGPLGVEGCTTRGPSFDTLQEKSCLRRFCFRQQRKRISIIFQAIFNLRKKKKKKNLKVKDEPITVLSGIKAVPGSTTPFLARRCHDPRPSSLTSKILLVSLS